MTDLEKAAQKHASRYESLGVAIVEAAEFDFKAGATWQAERSEGRIKELEWFVSKINEHVMPGEMDTKDAALKVFREQDKRISELETKLYHESRKAPEIEYLLENRITMLEGMNANQARTIDHLSSKITALESDLERTQEIAIDRGDRIAQLESALDVANKRIRELENETRS